MDDAVQLGVVEDSAHAPNWLADLPGEVGLSRGGSEHPSDDDYLLEAVEAEFAVLDAAIPTGSLWDRRRRVLPMPIVTFLLAAVHAAHVRDVVVSAAEDELLEGVHEDQRDLAAVEAIWRATCSRGRGPETLRWLRGVRDRVVRSYHCGTCYQHEHPKTFPPPLKRWRPEGGVLVVDDLPGTNPSVGYGPFLEQTPPLLVHYVYRRWLAGAIAAGCPRSAPDVWDFTAGSGTGPDVLAGLFRARVIATDLNPCNEIVGGLQILKVGTTYEHGGARLLGIPGVSSDNPPVRHPDIVLVDPPSRGTPTHSDIYAGERPALDLATLDRTTWIATVTFAVLTAVSRLAPLGVVSLMVRAGVRHQQRIEQDPELVEDVLAMIGPHVQVVEQVRLEFRNRVRQASLGTARVPATHLLLGARP